MRLKCSYCGKLVYTMRLGFEGHPSESRRGKLIRTVGTGFKVNSATTVQRRLKTEGVYTRVTCKTCKSKVKVQKPLDYLTKALESTLTSTDEMDEYFNIPSNDTLTEDKFFRATRFENLRRSEEVAYKLNVLNTARESGSWQRLVNANLRPRRQVRVPAIVNNMPVLRNEPILLNYDDEDMENGESIMQRFEIPHQVEVVYNEIPPPVYVQQERELDVPEEIENNMYDAMTARVSFMDKQLKEIEAQYCRLRKRMSDSLKATNKIDATVESAIKFLSRKYPENK